MSVAISAPMTSLADEEGLGQGSRKSKTKQLQELASMWESSVVVCFFETFAAQIPSLTFDPQLLNEGLCCCLPEEECCEAYRFLVNCHVELLNMRPGKLKRVSASNWEAAVRAIKELCYFHFADGTPFPTEAHHMDLSLRNKVLVLQLLVEEALGGQVIRDRIQPDKKLVPERPRPLGQDDQGACYWLFDMPKASDPFMRLYKEVWPAGEEAGSWELVAGDADHVEAFVACGWETRVPQLYTEILDKLQLFRQEQKQAERRQRREKQLGLNTSLIIQGDEGRRSRRARAGGPVNYAHDDYEFLDSRSWIAKQRCDRAQSDSDDEKERNPRSTHDGSGRQHRSRAERSKRRRKEDDTHQTVSSASLDVRVITETAQIVPQAVQNPSRLSPATTHEEEPLSPLIAAAMSHLPTRTVP